MNDQRELYEQKLETTADEDESRKIQALINTTNDILFSVENNMQTSAASSVGYGLHAVNVAAVIGYFHSQGWRLAAELLTHMRDNSVFNSKYTPINGSDINSSAKMGTIVNNNLLSGSDSFYSDGTRLGDDLHYAIIKFNYLKSESKKVIVVSDRYDYNPQDYPWLSIASVAVQWMYDAQQAGYLTPFYTIIETEMEPGNPPPISTDTINISGTDSMQQRYLERIFALGKGEYKDFNITYVHGGNKIIQTFGYKDTVIELYNASGSLLGSNDDQGYGTNALISYNFVANTTYKVRVKFWSSSTMGEVKLTCISSGSITNYEDIYAIPFSGVYSVAPVQSTKLYLYTPSARSTKSFQLEGTSGGTAIGMALHLIDPRSCVALGQPSATEYSPNIYYISTPAILTKELGSVPYLIIVSTHGMTSQVVYYLSIN